jgi:hypothetical protein
MKNAKFNWTAILVAAVASFLFEALWFTIFMNPWLTGVGRTREWLMSASTISPALQYVTAFLCSLIAAAILSIAIQITGQQTARRGILCAALIWLGFVATSWAKEYVFEVRTLQIFAINAGYSLFDLMIVGAIVGAWKKKPQVALP